MRVDHRYLKPSYFGFDPLVLLCNVHICSQQMCHFWDILDSLGCILDKYKLGRRSFSSCEIQVCQAEVALGRQCLLLLVIVDKD